MESVEKKRTAGGNAPFSMPKQMKLGPPTLRVQELVETEEFYRRLGLTEKSRYRDASDGLEMLELGPAASSAPVLIVKHDPGARIPKEDFAGLYHYAVLVPTRRSLAETYLAVGSSGIAYDGFADHYVSEALYLHDVERNGIEIYADRGRETWKAFFATSQNGVQDPKRMMSLNKPLDFASLLKELSRPERSSAAAFSAGARIGHIHLRVTDLERAVKFYHEVLGFDIVANYPQIGAAFLSVDGYHHHIGLNTWNSAGGTPHRAGVAGLENFVISVPDAQILETLNKRAGSAVINKTESSLLLSDPDGIRVALRK